MFVGFSRLSMVTAKDWSGADDEAFGEYEGYGLELGGGGYAKGLVGTCPVSNQRFEV